MKIGLTLCLLAFLLLLACRQSRDIYDIDRLDPVVEMYKSPCFGKCPVFTLTIYNNGLVTFKGDHFTEKMGLHYKKLARENYRALRKRFREAKLEQYEDHYPGNIPDLPKVTITFYRRNKVKSIKGDSERPAAVKELEKLLDEIAFSDGWTAKESPEPPLASYIIPEEIIVQFTEQADVPIWVSGFADVELALKERVAPNQMMWVITYNTEKIEPQAMLERVRRSEEVSLAEFNKRLEGRK